MLYYQIYIIPHFPLWVKENKEIFINKDNTEKKERYFGICLSKKIKKETRKTTKKPADLPAKDSF